MTVQPIAFSNVYVARPKSVKDNPRLSSDNGTLTRSRPPGSSLPIKPAATASSAGNCLRPWRCFTCMAICLTPTAPRTNSSSSAGHRSRSSSGIPRPGHSSTATTTGGTLIFRVLPCPLVSCSCCCPIFVHRCVCSMRSLIYRAACNGVVRLRQHIDHRSSHSNDSIHGGSHETFFSLRLCFSCCKRRRR